MGPKWGGAAIDRKGIAMNHGAFLLLLVTYLLLWLFWREDRKR